MSSNDFDFVIYHSPCADGTGAAFVVYYYNLLNTPERDIEYFPTSHHTPPPDVTGKKVLILDFSYKKEVIDQCRKQRGTERQFLL